MKTLLMLPALLMSGCILFAGKADYSDYREIRLAPNESARAEAMQTYVQRHPTGHWHDEIQSARSSQDLAAFEAGKDTRAGLEHYLRAYPDGAFVAQARGRLSAVALIEQRKQASDRQSQELAEARKLRTEELRRTWIGRFIAYWTQTMTGLKAWGEPIAEVARTNPQFSRAFAAQPRPRCTQDECLKYYTSQFAVPVPGGNRLERTLSLVLRLKLKAGKLERAELLLPEGGFSRWYELENRRAVADGDAVAREQAIAWAIERTLPTINALGEGLTPLKDSSVPVIDRPAIGPTGEQIDTSIEAPSDPQNRVSGQPDNAGIGVQGAKPEPGVADLVKPSDQTAPDMVFAPVGVGKQGQQVQLAPTPQAPAAVSGPGVQAPGEVMVIDPVAVPKSGNEPANPPATTPQTPAAPGPSAAPAAATVGAVRSFQWQGLRISLFGAAATSGTPGYDGLLIERASAAKPKAITKPGPPKPAGTTAPAPAPKPPAP